MGLRSGPFFDPTDVRLCPLILHALSPFPSAARDATALAAGVNGLAAASQSHLTGQGVGTPHVLHDDDSNAAPTDNDDDLPEVLSHPVGGQAAYTGHLPEEGSTTAGSPEPIVAPRSAAKGKSHVIDIEDEVELEPFLFYKCKGRPTKIYMALEDNMLAEFVTSKAKGGRGKFTRASNKAVEEWVRQGCGEGKGSY